MSIFSDELARLVSENSLRDTNVRRVAMDTADTLQSVLDIAPAASFGRNPKLNTKGARIVLDFPGNPPQIDIPVTGEVPIRWIGDAFNIYKTTNTGNVRITTFSEKDLNNFKQSGDTTPLASLIKYVQLEGFGLGSPESVFGHLNQVKAEAIQDETHYGVTKGQIEDQLERALARSVASRPNLRASGYTHNRDVS